MNDHNNQEKIAQIKEWAARIRGRKLLQIGRLRDGKVKKHLEGEIRLKAALFVRSRYGALLKPQGQFTMDEITRHLENFDGIPRGLKIHRWMLKKTVSEITPELVADYRERPEPQKKTWMYLKLVAALADMAGQDPDDAMIAFMDQTGLSDRLSSRPLDWIDEDLDPRLKLSDLLRHHAAHTAEQFDLASLFERAERLQAGWNPDRGPKAILLEDAFQRFTPASVFSGAWVVDALPPLPAVALASIPFGHLGDAGFVLEPAITPDGDDGPDDRQQERHMTGTATAFWHLHLAIAPQPGGGVQPCLLRTTRLSVTLDIGQDAEVLRADFDVDPHQDDLYELAPGNLRPASIELDGRRRITFDQETWKRLQKLENKGRVYRESRRNDETDEGPPHESIPLARLVSVAPQSIQDWLLDDLELAGAQVLRSPILSTFDSPTQDWPRTWFIAPSLARDLELAIRHDALQVGFRDWVTAYEASLKALEEERLTEMTAADLALRARWRADRDAMDQADGDE